MQRPLFAVPKGEAEHADEALDSAAEAPLFNRGQEHFGVGAAPELVALLLQLGADGDEVIDLPVEDDDVPFARRRHRLSPRRTQVDDRQPAEPEPETALSFDPLDRVIGSTVLHLHCHASRQRQQFDLALTWILPEPGDPAHRCPRLVAGATCSQTTPPWVTVHSGGAACYT